MNIIGVIAHQGHGSTAALISNGKLISAASEERFSRIKEDCNFPFQAIDSLLKDSKLELTDISALAFSWRPWISFLHQIPHAARNLKSFYQYAFMSREYNGQRSRAQKFRSMRSISREIKSRYGYTPRVHYIDHHLSHSMTAVCQSEFNNCLSFVIDGWGERHSCTVYKVTNGKHIKIATIPFKHSFGLYYSAITSYLGFRPEHDEYKVMGLASYGKNTYAKEFGQLFKNDSPKLNLDYFEHHKSSSGYESSKLHDLFGPESNLDFVSKSNIAKSAQLTLNNKVMEFIKRVSEKYPKQKACFSGGVFQNCVLNEHIRKSRYFQDCFFSPLSSDLGTSVGAAFVLNEKLGGPKKQTFHNLYLGSFFADNSIESTIRSSGLKYYRSKDICRISAQLLKDGNILGWFQGRSELGPRALGNRSILADPRNSKMCDKVNSKIKGRESFRPFAASVLSEDIDTYFEFPDDFRNYSFMIETLRVKDPAIRDFPAAVHVDKSTRPQFVSEKNNKKYHRLLRLFKEETGVPAVLNTSFNYSEEPIVESPKDAILCYKRGGLDYLVIEDFLVSRNELPDKYLLD